MTSEEKLIGQPMEEVPKIPPDGDCNARRGYWVDEDLKQDRRFNGYCNHPEGWGRGEDITEGRCKFHHGQDTIPDGGGTEGNQNAVTHGLSADPSNYEQHLDPEEAEWVRDVSAGIEDRIRRVRGDVDIVDRVLARRIAIKLHIVSNATDYIARSGLVQTIFTEDGSFDAKGPLVDELRRYDKEIVNEMKQLGIIDDPESKKADALDSWRQFVESGETTVNR